MCVIFLFFFLAPLKGFEHHIYAECSGKYFILLLKKICSTTGKTEKKSADPFEYYKHIKQKCLKYIK